MKVDFPNLAMRKVFVFIFSTGVYILNLYLDPYKNILEFV